MKESVLWNSRRGHTVHERSLGLPNLFEKKTYQRLPKACLFKFLFAIRIFSIVYFRRNYCYNGVQVIDSRINFMHTVSQYDSFDVDFIAFGYAVMFSIIFSPRRALLRTGFEEKSQIRIRQNYTCSDI
jgi:hypothetical protein